MDLFLAMILYPPFMYCVGLILRSAASSLMLKNSVHVAARLGVFVCADILSLLFHLFGGFILLDRYALSFLSQASARYDLAICEGLRLCVDYWSFYVLSDLIGALSVFFIYRIQVKRVRLAPVSAATKIRFIAIYVALALSILVVHYLAYPLIEIEMQALDPFANIPD